MEIKDAMKETSPVLSSFDLFNPEAVDKSKENLTDLLKTLCDHYDTSINDSYEGQTTTAAPVINPVHATSKFEDFMEAFDHALSFLNEKLKKSAKQLVGKIMILKHISKRKEQHQPMSISTWQQTVH